ncbi:hypothetical protein ACF0H5_017282 [Mactra antiquata]
MCSCCKARKVLIAAVCCLFVAFILAAVGFATPNWSVVTRRVTYTDGSTTIKQEAGLWQQCTHVLDTTSCDSRQNTTDWFRAVQVLMSLAILGLIVALIISCLLLCIIRNRKVKYVNIGIIAVSGLFIIIAVILYGMKKDDITNTSPITIGSVADIDSDHEYGYSYILCYIADFFLFIIVISLFVWDLRSHDADRERNVHFYERDPSHVPFEYRHNVRIREIQPGDQKYYANPNPKALPYPDLYSDSRSSSRSSSQAPPYSRYLEAPPSSRSYSDPQTRISYIAGNSHAYDGRGEVIPYTGRDHWTFDDAWRKYKR